MVKSSRRSLNDEWGHPGRSKLPTRNALWKTFRGNCAAQSSQRISNFRCLTLFLQFCLQECISSWQDIFQIWPEKALFFGKLHLYGCLLMKMITIL